MAEPAAETPRSKTIKRLSELTEEARKLESNTFTDFANQIDPEVNKEAIAEYADDPNSRINKSLRAWNCKEGGSVRGDGCEVRGKTKGKMV